MTRFWILDFRFWIGRVGCFNPAGCVQSKIQNPKSKIVALALLLALLAGCVSSERQFRLEEWGEGWTLNVREVDGRDFRASWVPGDNRSLQIVNYHDAPQGGFTVINTLYLEVEKDGTVTNGMLKRVAVADFSRQAYAEQPARWFKVLEGWCRLDEEGRGELKVRTQGGFEFEGDVRPMRGLQVRRPE
jgi:hypothetical protein